MRSCLRSSCTIVAASLSLMSMVSPSPAAHPPALTLELVTSDIRKPVAAFSPPGDPSQLLIVERSKKTHARDVPVRLSIDPVRADPNLPPAAAQLPCDFC